MKTKQKQNQLKKNRRTRTRRTRRKTSRRGGAASESKVVPEVVTEVASDTESTASIQVPAKNGKQNSFPGFDLKALIQEAKKLITNSNQTKTVEVLGEDYLLHLLLIDNSSQQLELVRKIIIQSGEYKKLSASIESKISDVYTRNGLVSVADNILAISKRLNIKENDKKTNASGLAGRLMARSSFTPIYTDSEYNYYVGAGLTKEITLFKTRYGLNNNKSTP